MENEKDNSIDSEEKQKGKMGNKTIWKPEVKAQIIYKLGRENPY